MLLRGTVLPITLLKYTQQGAEPQNKNSLFFKLLWLGTYQQVQEVLPIEQEASCGRKMMDTGNSFSN
jgi:hypothetical protein